MAQMTLTISDDDLQACEAYIAHTRQQADSPMRPMGTAHPFETVEGLLWRMMELGMLEVRRWYAQQQESRPDA